MKPGRKTKSSARAPRSIAQKRYTARRSVRAGQDRRASRSSTRPSTSRCAWASTRATPIRWCAARWCCRTASARPKRVLVFAKGEKAAEAEAAGADFVGADDLVAKVQDGFLDFDTVIATPDMMGQVGRLGRVLGPRGLMPNPKVGTVTFDVKKAVTRGQGRQDRVPRREGGHRARAGRQEVVRRRPSSPTTCKALMDALVKAKPSTAKGTYLQQHHAEHDHGPGHQDRSAVVIGGGWRR